MACMLPVLALVGSAGACCCGETSCGGCGGERSGGGAAACMLPVLALVECAGTCCCGETTCGGCGGETSGGMLPVLALVGIARSDARRLFADSATASGDGLRLFVLLVNLPLIKGESGVISCSTRPCTILVGSPASDAMSMSTITLPARSAAIFMYFAWTLAAVATSLMTSCLKVSWSPIKLKSTSSVSVRSTASCQETAALGSACSDGAAMTSFSVLSAASLSSCFWYSGRSKSVSAACWATTSIIPAHWRGEP